MLVQNLFKVSFQTANYSSLRSQTQDRLLAHPLLMEGLPGDTDVTERVWLYNASRPRADPLATSGPKVKATNWYFDKWRQHGT